MKFISPIKPIDDELRSDEMRVSAKIIKGKAFKKRK
jgi:hypothetical protein